MGEENNERKSQQVRFFQSEGKPVKSIKANRLDVIKKNKKYDEAWESWRLCKTKQHEDSVEACGKELQNSIDNYLSCYWQVVCKGVEYIIISIGGGSENSQQRPPFIESFKRSKTKFTILNIDPQYNEESSCSLQSEDNIYYLPAKVGDMKDIRPNASKGLCEVVKAGIENGKKVIIMNFVIPAAHPILYEIATFANLEKEVGRSLILLGAYYVSYPVFKYDLTFFSENNLSRRNEFYSKMFNSGKPPTNFSNIIKEYEMEKHLVAFSSINKIKVEELFPDYTAAKESGKESTPSAKDESPPSSCTIL